MKITVINGTEKRGVTYQLKEAFLEPFKQSAEITEYNLPRDCPSFCVGCTGCFLKGEDTCKDYAYIHPIEASLLEADLIVWWGISEIGAFCGALMSNTIVWKELPAKKRKKLTARVGRLARKFAKIDYKKPARTKPITKIKFALCRLIQKKVLKSGIGGLDGEYWQEHGWLDQNRPWKRQKKI